MKGQIRIIRLPFADYREDTSRPVHPSMESVELEAREELATALDEGYRVVTTFNVPQKGHLTLVMVMYLAPDCKRTEKRLSEVNGRGCHG